MGETNSVKFTPEWLTNKQKLPSSSQQHGGARRGKSGSSIAYKHSHTLSNGSMKFQSTAPGPSFPSGGLSTEAMSSETRFNATARQLSRSKSLNTLATVQQGASLSSSSASLPSSNSNSTTLSPIPKEAKRSTSKTIEEGNTFERNFPSLGSQKKSKSSGALLSFTDNSKKATTWSARASISVTPENAQSTAPQPSPNANIIKSSELDRARSLVPRTKTKPSQSKSREMGNQKDFFKKAPSEPILSLPGDGSKQHTSRMPFLPSATVMIKTEKSSQAVSATQKLFVPVKPRSPSPPPIVLAPSQISTGKHKRKTKSKSKSEKQVSVPDLVNFNDSHTPSNDAAISVSRDAFGTPSTNPKRETTELKLIISSQKAKEITIKQEDEDRLLRAFGWTPDSQDDFRGEFTEEEIERMRNEIAKKDLNKIRKTRVNQLDTSLRQRQSKQSNSDDQIAEDALSIGAPYTNGANSNSSLQRSLSSSVIDANAT